MNTLNELSPGERVLRRLMISYMSGLRSGPGRRGASDQPVHPTMLRCDSEDCYSGALEILGLQCCEMVNTTK